MEVPDDHWQTYAIIDGNGDDCTMYWPFAEGAPFRLTQPKEEP